MKVRKFNYYRFFIFIGVTLSILFCIIFYSIKFIKDYNYKKTYDYKLLSAGYSEEEVKVIKDKFSNDKIDILLKEKYDKNVVSFIKEKYFIYNNLSKYMEYKKKNKNDTYTHVVSIINTEADVEWLDNEKETDTSKGNLMLVNRLYGLSKDYEPEDIIDVPVSISYSGVKISKSILENIEELIEAGKEEGYTFVLSDGYRSYEAQKRCLKVIRIVMGMKKQIKMLLDQDIQSIKQEYLFK